MKLSFNILPLLSLAVLLLMTACVPSYNTVSSPVSNFAFDDIDYKVTEIDASFLDSSRRSFETNPPVVVPKKEELYDYVVGAGDVLLINLYVVSADGSSGLTRIFPKAPALSSENRFLVNGDGIISIPYAGKVRVGDKPFSQVQKIVEKSLSKYFLDPQLEMSVADFGSSRALISGEVTEPQELTLTHKPLTVMDAITQAKGALPTADLRSASITRKNGMLEEIDVAALIFEGASQFNKTLYAGDTLTIPRNHANQLYVMGEVVEPKTLTINAAGMNLTEALGAVKGLNLDTGDASEIYILREHVGVQKDKRKMSIYHLDGNNPKTYVYATKFNVQPQDVLYIGTQQVTNWSRFINQLLPIGFSALIQPAPYILR